MSNQVTASSSDSVDWQCFSGSLVEDIPRHTPQRRPAMPDAVLPGCGDAKPSKARSAAFQGQGPSIYLAHLHVPLLWVLVEVGIPAKGSLMEPRLNIFFEPCSNQNELSRFEEGHGLWRLCVRCLLVRALSAGVLNLHESAIETMASLPSTSFC